MLWCVVYVILRCGKLSVRPSVCLSVCPSLCEHVSAPITLVLYQMIRHTYCLWLPNFQGHMANFKVTQAQKTLVKRVKFRVSGYFLDNTGGGIPYAAVSWPPNYILITVCWFLLILVAFWLNETKCGFRIWWRTHDSNGLEFGMPVYPDYPQNCLYLVTVCWYSSFLTI